VQYVAILGDDTPAFRAEQELMNSERVGFFMDATCAEQWLDRVRGAEDGAPDRPVGLPTSASG
jgi:hypothetical protein